MPTSTLTSKGQITVPRQIRELLGVAEGDEIDFVVEHDRKVWVRPRHGSVRSLQGMARFQGKGTRTLQALDRAVEEYLSAKHRAIRSQGKRRG